MHNASMSGSCHLDRALNVEIGIECQIFVIAIFFYLRSSFTIWGTFKVLHNGENDSQKRQSQL